jgi:hypothetical protein
MSRRPLSISVEHDPRRRVVARLLAPAHRAVDAGLHQALPRRGIEQQVVDAQPASREKRSRK